MTPVELLTSMATLKRSMQNSSIFIVEEWLLEHGEDFGPVVKVPGVGMGLPKECFANSFRALLRERIDPAEWFYTEGSFVWKDIPIDIHHAWLSNRKGEVLDLTLRDTSHGQFFGVPFAWDFVQRQIEQQSYSGLFSDGIRYNELVQQPLAAERRAWVKKEEN